MARDFRAFTNRFLGLNESGPSESSLKSGESPKMKNLKITPSYTLALREGYECLCESEGEGRGLTVYNGVAYFVVGRFVYSYDGEKKMIGELESETGKVFFLHFGESFYILDGVKIKKWCGGVFSDIEPYVPLIAISTDVNGGGVPFEDINLLTPKRRQSFTADTDHTRLILAEQNIDSVESVKRLGEELPKTAYTVYLEEGEVQLSASNPSTEINAYEVTYSKKIPEENNPHRMKYAVLWGGDNDTRVFLWGDVEKPDVYRYSGVHDGVSGMDYFPELSFNKSATGRPITSLVRHYDRLLIFTDREAYYSYIEKKSDSSGMEYLSFPVRTLSSEVGCLHPNTAVLVDNTPLTLSGTSLYRWVSTTVRDERNAEEIGSRIRKGLIFLSNGLSVFDRTGHGEVYLWREGKIYVYNYRLDLFYYYEGLDAVAFHEDSTGSCFFLTPDGKLCRMTEESLDMGHPVDFEWETGYSEYAGLDTKNIHSIEFEVIPKSSVSFDILWASDTMTGKGMGMGAEYKVLDFESLFFDRFSFKSAITPIRIRKRVKLKRQKSFKLIVKSNENSLDFHLVSLCIRGRITDAI